MSPNANVDSTVFKEEATTKSFEIDEEDPSSSSNSNSIVKQGGEEEENLRTKGFVVIVAIAAALGGLIFGYDIGGAGATFVMDGFKIHFGWECVPDDLDCVPAPESEINKDQGLINGLFGAGAAL